jgi:hypothetical protein
VRAALGPYQDAGVLDFRGYDLLQAADRLVALVIVVWPAAVGWTVARLHRTLGFAAIAPFCLSYPGLAIWSHARQFDSFVRMLKADPVEVTVTLVVLYALPPLLGTGPHPHG